MAVSPANRFGYLRIACANWSLKVSASDVPVAASNTCTPGLVSARICLAMPVSSMSRMRCSPRSWMRAINCVARGPGFPA